MAAAGLLAAVLVARLAYWQVLQHERIVLLAARQHQVTVRLPAHRGNVLDRAGQILATDTPVYDIVALPDVIPASSREATAGALAPLLGIDSRTIVGKLTMPLKFEYLKRKVDKDTADKIDGLHLAGIARETDSKRSYLPSPDAGPALVIPAGIKPLTLPGDRSLASNLLGFVNDDNHGQYGIEQFYDHVLNGVDGFESTLKDGAEQTIVLSDRKRVEPRNGQDLVLGIDSQVQYFAEKALAAGVKRTGSESGSVIVMDPRTGAIVAWADYPTFDANRFGQSDPAYFTDPIVSSLYEPGSVMKVVTLSGGLDSGAITPTFTFNETGAISVGGYTIHDWDLKPHGNIDMTYVLAHSLNAGAVKVEQMEGGSKFYAYLNNFGIGRVTGIDIAGEVNRQLPPLKDAHASELATASFGQGIAVTPIEMMTALNAIADGGRLVKPHLVTGTRDPGTGVLTPTAVDPGVPAITPATDQQMTQMMVNVVEHGSGWTAKMDGWTNRIAGKTGTANIPEKGVYTDKVVASFFGFMPAENPRFSMIVIMRKPQGGGFQQEGTFASAPVWKEIAQQILTQWQITP